MNKKMTIIEAIRTVLLKNGSGMTVEEIFDKIIDGVAEYKVISAKKQ